MGHRLTMPLFSKFNDMALSLSLSYLQQSSCAELVLTDTTGAYDAVSNTGGWGSPNLACDDGSVTYAEIIIKQYTDSATLVDYETIDLIADWETVTGLTSDPFDSGTTVANMIYTLDLALEDGCYQITYQVGDGTTYDNSSNRATVTYNIATYCNIECCVDQRVANSPTEYSCITCDNAYMDITNILWTLLQSLKLAACNASIDNYLSILSILQSAADDAGCNC